jgi:hypothetical protein
VPEVTEEILAKLISAAKANGLDLGLAPDGSEIGDLKPIIAAVNLNRATSEIAHETGANLKGSGLYVYSERLVTVNEDGTTRDMDSKRFRSWIDTYQLNYYKRRMLKDGDETKLGPPIKATMKKDVVDVLLASDEFLSHLPVIKRIVPVRLPVWEADEEGGRRVRLLPFGYDLETMIFTRNTGIEYLENWTLQNAVDYLRTLLKDFPFADEGRSLSVQISAMLTIFCQFLFFERDRWPLIYFNANTPGSGKSRLAEMCIYAIYGEALPLTYSENDEFVKKLDTWAQQGMAYMFLDNLTGLVKNNDLDRWLTCPMWAFRRMHTQTMGSVLNQTLPLLTGNQATLSDDLTRRSLMVDLWSSQRPEDRMESLSINIDAEWLTAPKNRGDMLSAFYALVRHWSHDHGGKVYHKLIPSFEGWSRIIPSIVTLAGFNCPLEKPNVQDAGGKQEVEFFRLIAAAVAEHEPTPGKPVALLLTEWCRLARKHGLFHAVISDVETMRSVLDASPRLYKPMKDAGGADQLLTEGDKDFQAACYMEKGQSTKFGGLLHKFYRGQERKINGVWYKFADREARHSTFALEVVDRPGSPAPEPPPAEPEADLSAVVETPAEEEEKPPF